jgi:C4-dicarboxylate-specific signal transduction histidine kinase
LSAHHVICAAIASSSLRGGLRLYTLQSFLSSMRVRGNIARMGLRRLIAAVLVLAASMPAAAASEPGILDHRGGLLVLLGLALAVQAAVIVALVAKTRRMRRVELTARAQLTEISQMNRLAAAGELSASISHEIKQPLAAIAANANAALRWLSRKEPDMGEARAALERIVGEAHRASDVIGGIRAMFKKAAADKGPVDVNSLIREVLALLDRDLETRRIAVETDLPSGLPAVVGCQAQLQQVFLNVVTNAVEAMDTVAERARRLRVTSRSHDADGVLITVEDSGTGIDPQNAKQIFEPFYTTKQQGMGLGLSICRSIVESHGGRLSAAPGALHGLALRISLPAGQAGHA